MEETQEAIKPEPALSTKVLIVITVACGFFAIIINILGVGHIIFSLFVLILGLFTSIIKDKEEKRNEKERIYSGRLTIKNNI